MKPSHGHGSRANDPGCVAAGPALRLYSGLDKGTVVKVETVEVNLQLQRRINVYLWSFERQLGRKWAIYYLGT